MNDESSKIKDDNLFLKENEDPYSHIKEEEEDSSNF
jgi:hypothetical protein